MKNKVTVTIGGLDYTILADESEEHIKRAAALVDRKMAELNGAPLSAVQKAVLAALNIADDYYKHQDSMSELRQQLLRR
ncbi:MAG: cell division protein ZapA [Clostridia bacterium]|nr:cell division protein ZapA [Oscillospiraceae bacterium]MBQ6837081.1 cell division protein ZapA [Clostridia bacterium]MBQ7087884.1 cell division protein ZapA [Clostridia bacterium]